MEKTETFQIGDFCFQLRYPKEITPPPNFMLFRKEGAAPEYEYEIQIRSDFPKAAGRQTAMRPDLAVFTDGNREMRFIGVKGTEGYYACYEETTDRSARIYLDPARLGGLNIDPVFSSLLALERRLISRDSLILHCAYVEYRGKAILFSAPSETGKTTQANLWEKYRGSRTVNGDRGLLTRKGNEWIVQGWPVCGTSEICENETMPVRAIVMLEQAKEDHARLLAKGEAFSLLYSQITINRWNTQAHMYAMDLIEDVLSHIPVYQLGCTISRHAVECLDDAMHLSC